MNDYEIIIAGGGPIGCFTAEQLALQNIRVAILEEHSNIGEPVHCAGLVTPRVFNITNSTETKIIQNKIFGAHIHSPDGSILTIGGDKIHALVINRQQFDYSLAHAAQTAGAQLLTGNKIISVKKQNHEITLSIQNNNNIKTIQSHLLIGADGSNSFIRSSFKFPKPIEIIQGIGAELSDTQLNPHFVHIFIGHTIAPGFFAWIIPTNPQGTTARIGLCIRKQNSYSLQHYFNILLKQHLLQGTKIIKRFGGTIPLGSLNKTVDNHVMLVGDSAAQVKPISGGGLYPGLLCATYCALVAKEAIKKQNFNSTILKKYHTLWTKEIGRELALGIKFRKIFINLTDNQFNKILRKLNNKKIIDIINNFGDIDYPSRLTFPILKASPSLFSLIPSVIKKKK